MIYHLSRTFPPSEDYRLTSQITRAAVSIPANIAEGQARSTRKDFANFLMMAKGSLNETETLLMVARRQEFVTEAAARPAFLLMTEVSKMLTVLRRKLLGTRDASLVTSKHRSPSMHFSLSTVH